MADEGPKKPGVGPATHLPTERDIAALQVVHRMTDRLVLAPVFINGEPRIALALLSRNEDGAAVLQVIANLVQPTDVVLDSRGCPGYNKTPPVKKDLN